MRISDWSSDVCSSDLSAMIAGEPSRDASSTRISSKSPKSCASTDSIASASQRAPLCTGITIDTRGGAVESSVDRKSVGEGKSGTVSVDLGGRGILKKKKKQITK